MLYTSVFELRVGEGESLKFCLVEGPNHVILHWCQYRVLGSKVSIKVAEVTL